MYGNGTAELCQIFQYLGVKLGTKLYFIEISKLGNQINWLGTSCYFYMQTLGLG